MINNTGGRESRRSKDNSRDFKPKRVNKEGLALLDVEESGGETSGRNSRADC